MIIPLIADLALFRIDPPFDENERVEPIPINDEIRDLRGQEVLISGWGATTKKTLSTELKKAFVRITSQNSGTTPQSGKVLNMFSPDGIGACFGDSGGNRTYKCCYILFYILLYKF